MKNTQKIASILGKNIQLARLNKHLTQENLAEACNVSAKYISALERGRTLGSIPLIIDICNALCVAPDYIFKDIVSLTNKSKEIETISKSALISFSKLDSDNQNFVYDTITHLYNMQKKR